MAKAKRTRVAIHIPSRMFEKAKAEAEIMEDSISGILSNIIIAYYSKIIETEHVQETKEAVKPVKVEKVPEKELIRQARALMDKADKNLKYYRILADGEKHAVKMFTEVDAGYFVFVDNYEEKTYNDPAYVIEYMNKTYWALLNEEAYGDAFIMETMRSIGDFTKDKYEELTQ